jgi:IS30 family transposase
VADDGLAEVVRAKLELDWSPQQIAAHRGITYPDRAAWHVRHEPIYPALHNVIWRPEQGIEAPTAHWMTVARACADSPTGAPFGS